ncbi:MAG: antitoxin component YwqK of YwqJK toxin-antitoxin module [Roseivirga sp.]|jgi:antitoxin component YwqK of YwqJK toxin-antitoxin module
MTREEHIVFCKKCTNRKFDPNQGLICRITDKKADFEDECPSFNLDEFVKETIQESQVEMPNHEFVKLLSEERKAQFRQHQDFSSAIIGGVLISILSAFIWAIVTVSTEYQIGYMAIGVGFLVGFSVRFFGAGVDQKFGIAGALLALFGCLLGNFLSQIGFVAEAEGLGYFQALQLFDWVYLPDVYIESFTIMDLLFYGFAIAAGYKFAFRDITPEEVEELKISKFIPLPLGYVYRRPALIAAFILFGLFLFKFNQGTDGEVTYKYEDGSKMSQGQYEGGKENGPWTYWYPDGKLQAEVNYEDGNPNGNWTFYDLIGNKEQESNFKNGMLDGSYITYTSGVVIVKGQYLNNREIGDWEYNYENGNVNQKGSFVRGMQSGEWKSYYDDGKLSSQGKMEEGENTGLWKYWDGSGQLLSEFNFMGENVIETLNYWSKDGEQMVTNGMGYIKEFSGDGVLITEGRVENKRKIGKWSTNYEDGSKMEEGEYINGEYLIINAWDLNSKPLVVNRNGTSEKFNTVTFELIEAGEITNGRREGLWKTYFPETGNLSVISNYKNGKADGEQSAYSEAGALLTDGEMKDGLKIGKWTWYYDDGTTESTAQMVNGKKEGSQFFYNAQGDKIKEEIYKEGAFQEETVFEN